MSSPVFQADFAVRDYDLGATLSCGQAFRWILRGEGWEGVIDRRWVRLSPGGRGFIAETAVPTTEWLWLKSYLQTEVDLGGIILPTFPDDEPMRAAVAACRGLRLLRQDPWECLASFLLSSTKQIVQIQQIIGLLCERFGEPLIVPVGRQPVRSFPSAACLAAASEMELRECKMGFRAPNVLTAARRVAAGEIDLDRLRTQSLEEARATLLKLPGVGEKIANCVLLFAYGFAQAFPVDVWVMKALRELYFLRRRPKPERVRQFVSSYFGVHAGYAQQYLFHYMRTRGKTVAR